MTAIARGISHISGTAVSMPEDRIDTDLIFPARFLLQVQRQGLGRFLFHDRRQTPDGRLDLQFPLNIAGAQTAAILIAGANFGCGSSREHAVWALHDWGFRCIVAPSMGEIFFANCIRSLLVPIILPDATVAALHTHAQYGAKFHIDVAAKTLSVQDGPEFVFNLAPELCEALLSGWDEIELIERRHGAAIAAFEQNRSQKAVQS